MIKYLEMDYDKYCEIQYKNISFVGNNRFESARGILGRHCEYIIPEYCEKKGVNSVKLIDIGCTNGFLSDVINEKLPNYEIGYYGLEIADHFVNYAKKVGHNVSQGDICKYNRKLIRQYSTFDILIARQMLQFVQNMEIAIKNMLKFVRLGGYIYIVQTVPYEMKDAIWIDGTAHPHHYNSVDSIDDILGLFDGHKILNAKPLLGYGEQVIIVEKY